MEYFNTGPDQVLGLIAQGLDGCTGNGLDPEFGYVMTVINANDEDQTLDVAEFAGDTFTLHPVLQTSVDTVVQTASHDASGFFVPARTTAVFVRAEQLQLFAVRRRCVRAWAQPGLERTARPTS